MSVQTIICWLPELFGKIHPAMAHVPIGLLLFAVVAESIGWFRRKPQFQFAGKFCLLFGAAGALVTSLSGFPLTTLVYNSYVPPMLLWHKYLGLGACVAAVVAGLVGLLAGPKLSGTLRLVYFLLLVLVAALILATGHTGGMLVYGDNYYSPP